MTKASANNSKQNKNVKSVRSAETGSQTFSSWLRGITQKSVNTVVKIFSDAFYIPPPPKQLPPSEGSIINEQSLTPLSLPSPVTQSVSVNNVFGESHQQPSIEPENSPVAIIMDTMPSIQSNMENVTVTPQQTTTNEDNADSSETATSLTVCAPTATDSEIETQSQSVISDGEVIEDPIDETTDSRVISTVITATSTNT